MDGSKSDGAATLVRLCRGDGSAQKELFELVYDRLRQVAGRLMESERQGHTLAPTALVHEAWLELVDQDAIGDVPIEEARRRFVGLAAHAMRRVLVDHARRGQRLKRGGAHQRVTLAGDLPLEDVDPATLLDLEGAIEGLAKRSSRLAEVAELRLFGGLSSQEIAAVLSISLTTAKDDWTMARAMLSRSLGPSE